MIRFIKTDDAQESVFYQGPEGELLSFRRTSHHSFTLVSCGDGAEPGQRIDSTGIKLDRVPKDESKTSIDFRAWRSANHWLDEQN